MKDYVAQNKAQTISETDAFTVERYQQFNKFFTINTEKILDIGCNTGRGGAELKRINNKYKIYGLDVVEDRLMLLSDDIYIKKILGSAAEIPIEDNFFDIVVAGEFIEHLYAQDVSRTIGEVFRVLKIGGFFLLTTPNPYDIKRIIRKETILGNSHVSQHFPNILKIQLQMAGFSNIKIMGSGKTSRYLGMRFPCLSLYGSYLAIAKKW
ncbi:class I SAM-dependent methyltransferase [Yeosuana sp. AK3]